MRYVTFRSGPEANGSHNDSDSGRDSVGVLVGEQVADLSHPACAALMDGRSPSLLRMIEEGLPRWTYRLGAPFPAECLRPLAGVRLRSPLMPGKIVGAAFNFADALAERKMEPPAEPVTFVRSGSTVIGPGDPILIPPDVGNVGYEAELAVVIGRRALRVSPEDAMRYVAGYTAHNDVSGSDLVKGDGGNFVRGKNLPASSPLGPWLSTPDEVPDPYALRIRLDVDGRPLQDGSAGSMVFRIAQLISFVSYRMPLDPGDVIATGTPAGVAAMHQPAGWLRPGSTVTVEVQGFGRLSNPILHGEPFLD